MLQEASTLDQLQHPAIIRLRHCGYADPHARSRPFIEMDYFESETLESYVRKNGPLSVADLLAVARPLAEALEAAHGQGILHRDVKPANLLVRAPARKWEVKVIDFGLALKQSLLETEVSSGRASRSMTGAEIAGTRHYAAPEQLGELPGVRAGPKADVYGFAKTCCYALFQNTEPTLREWDRVPRALGKLLSDCLERSPNDRPAGFAEVLTRLDDFMRPAAAVPTPRPASKPTPRPTPAPAPPKPARPPQPPPIRPIHELPANELPAAIPVRRPAYPQALPAAKVVPLMLKPPPVPPGPGKAEDAIKAPAALSLLAVNVLSLLCYGLMLLSPFFMEERFTGEMVLGWLVFVILAVASVFSLVGAVLMLNRKLWVLSLIGCAAGILSVGPCGLSVAVGVGGVMTLLRPEGRGTFTLTASRERERPEGASSSGRSRSRPRQKASASYNDGSRPGGSNIMGVRSWDTTGAACGAPNDSSAPTNRKCGWRPRRGRKAVPPWHRRAFSAR